MTQPSLKVLARWPMRPEERNIIASAWPELKDVVVSDRRDSKEGKRLIADVDVVVGFLDLREYSLDLRENLPHMRMDHGS